MTDLIPPQRTAPGPVSSRLIPLLAVACGVAVGNVYFPQAIGPLAAAGLHVSPAAAATVVTATQLGYATGIFLLVPLGDRLPHRPLLVTLLTLTGLGLCAAAAAPALPPLLAASVLVGATTVIAPLAGPLAAGLVPAERRGVVGGTLLSGSLAGMLLSRTAGGALGDRLGWRAPYLLAALLSLAVAALLARVLPSASPPATHRYPALLAQPLRLLCTEPELRRSCLYQAAVFAGFSAAWTGVALLLTGPVYGLGADAVGLLALVNAATMVVTPLAGRQVDRRGPDAVNLVCFLGVLLSAAVLAPGSRGGAPGLAALAAGTLLLDIGMQCGMVANQVRIYALGAGVRSRLNTAYMTCAYLGGSVGSWLGARAYGRFGWPGVCALVALLTAAALARHLRVRPGSGHKGSPAGGLEPPAGWRAGSAARRPPARGRHADDGRTRAVAAAEGPPRIVPADAARRGATGPLAGRPATRALPGVGRTAPDGDVVAGVHGGPAHAAGDTAAPLDASADPAGGVAAPLGASADPRGAQVARLGVGPAVPVLALPRSWAVARTALRFTAEGTERDPGRRVVYADELGGLAFLADLAVPGAEPPADVRAVEAAAADAPWMLRTLHAVAWTASLRAAAAEITVHHSTLQDRLTHAEHLLGRPVRTPKGRLRHQLALAMRQLARHQ
ncbi:MFS transporter [Streptomyces sp. NPDC006739]|uniref:MFS transporter n=1 Tax=Streptomyces sp. NPDC006739 TaxID=3364763 RepID=UPI0036A982AD